MHMTDMLVSSYFLIGRRFCRRFFILTGLFVFAVCVYVVVAFLWLYALPSDRERQPICLRPLLDPDVDRPSPESPRPLSCHEDEPDWIDPSNGTFQVTTQARQRHGDVVCQYVPVLRGADDFQVVHGRQIKPMPDGAPLPSDFFEARCVGSDGAVHVGIYSGIATEPMVLERCRSMLTMNSIEVPQLDIVIVGFDSVSRTSWIRQLSKSHEYMTNNLGAAVFTGYNIVGDGTPQALLPLLTGKTEDELPEARRGFRGARNVDEHPWIWRHLKDVDYITQWAEDSASVGTFTYRMLGFRRQPVDHYMRTFYLASERRYPTYRPFCIGSTPRHVNMLSWQRQFLERYADCRKFSFIFHSEFSHDDSSRLPLADDDLRQHLAAMHDSGQLDKSVLVLMSDHGPRFDHTRRTPRGKYDERLPYMAIRLPAWFTSKHPTAAENLRLNAESGRLVTAFDVHFTLLDIVHLVAGQHTVPEQPEVTWNNGRLPRGISLLSEVPVDRTCADADIAPHWCACLRWRPLSVDSVQVQRVSQRVVDVINSMTSPYRNQCAKLRLDDVIGADSFADDDRLLHFRRSSDVHGRVPEMSDTMNATELLYRVVLRTRPGSALFEATVRHQLSSGAPQNQLDVDPRQISRTNQYSRQPHCVMDQLPHLRPFCYCVVQEASTQLGV